MQRKRLLFLAFSRVLVGTIVGADVGLHPVVQQTGGIEAVQQVRDLVLQRRSRIESNAHGEGGDALLHDVDVVATGRHADLVVEEVVALHEGAVAATEHVFDALVLGHDAESGGHLAHVVVSGEFRLF